MGDWPCLHTATLAAWVSVLCGLESGTEIGPEIGICFRAQILEPKWNQHRGNLQWDPPKLVPETAPHHGTSFGTHLHEVPNTWHSLSI